MDEGFKISVISACYNHGRFVNEMIGSVLHQTFTDFEIIVVNDGSTDDTAAILNSIKNEKVRIFHTENRGPAAARNTAIASARAQFILNLDADDKIGPGFLEKGYEALINNPNAGIVFSDVELFGAKSGRFETGGFSPEAMLTENRISSIAFFRKEDWQRTGGYCDEFRSGLEDWDLWLSILGLGRDAVKINGTYAFYRTYSDIDASRSGKRRNNRIQMMESQVLIFNRHRELYRDHPESAAFFLTIEEKLISEKPFVRKVKNSLYKYLRKYYWDN